MLGKTLLACLLVAGASACAAGEEIKWTEEVRLHDGKVIEVKRRIEMSGSGFPAQRRGRPLYHELCYAPMNLHWKSKPEYAPENLDIVGGKAYVRVALGGCSTCMLHGYPESGALHFLWEGGAWKRIEAADFPRQLRLNLIRNPQQAREEDAARGLIRLADKDRFDIGLRAEMRGAGARWVTDLPSYRDMCTKCKGTSTKTDRTPEVFLPSKSKRCDG